MPFFHAPSRRDVMLASGTLFAWTYMPKLALAEGRDPRFLTIILRGALDGLATVAPVGDPGWIALRGDNALTLDSKTPALRLDDFFALNPAMRNLHRMFQANEAIIVHACATPYRERSHFDGQDLLESGLPKPGVSDSGWLNRALSGLAPGGRVDPKGGKIFAVGPVTPLVVRGPAPVLSWSPQRVMPASADTVQRLLDLYRHSDQKLASVLEDNARLTAIEHSGDMAQKPGGPGPAQVRAYFAEAAGTAAKFLAQPDGPRVGALALDGWDTHSNEGIAQGRLSQLLGALDDALGRGGDQYGTGLARHRRRARDRVRPHRPHQRHRRHRPRHRDGGASRRRRAERRPRDRRLAGAEKRRPLREPRSQTDDRSARGAERLVEGSPARRRPRACAKMFFPAVPA